MARSSVSRNSRSSRGSRDKSGGMDMGSTLLTVVLLALLGYVLYGLIKPATSNDDKKDNENKENYQRCCK
jgi:hypothetical protein